MAREAGRIHNEKESKKMAPGRPEAGIRAVGGKKRRSGDTSGRRLELFRELFAVFPGPEKI